jgi:hypothetical protein
VNGEQAGPQRMQTIPRRKEDEYARLSCRKSIEIAVAKLEWGELCIELGLDHDTIPKDVRTDHVRATVIGSSNHLAAEGQRAELRTTA